LTSEKRFKRASECKSGTESKKGLGGRITGE